MSYEDGGTMIDAIALSSPSGRMSKRALKAAQARLAKELFPNGLPKPITPPFNAKESLLRRARELRELAARGMHVRSYPKEAARLEAQAEAL